MVIQTSHLATTSEDNVPVLTEVPVDGTTVSGEAVPDQYAAQFGVARVF